MALGLLGICLFAAPVSASAYNVFDGVDCGKTDQAKSAVCQSKTNNDPISGDNGILLKVTNIIALVAGIAAIIIIIISGINFMTSGGDSAKVASARSALIGALIGIAVIVLARALITYVVKQL